MIEKLSLEERIARAKRSQAASPESAAGLVRKLSQLNMDHVFLTGDDIDLMSEQIGVFLDQIEGPVLYYSGLCRGLRLASIHAKSQTESNARSRMILETRCKNAVVLLGLMLLDHAKGRGQDREVYHCTRMTLGQYLDALETLAYPGKDGLCQTFRSWRELFLESADPAAPLADVLANLLRQYIRGWTVLDFLKRVLYCMNKLSCRLEGDPDLEFEEDMHQQMEAAYLKPEKEEEWDDEWEECPDAGGYFEEQMVGPSQKFREAVHRCIDEARLAGAEEEGQYADLSKDYFNLATAYFWDVADPAGETISAGEMRSGILLTSWDCSSQALKERLAGRPTSPAFRALLERFISEQWPSMAISEVNMAVYNLSMLWVRPYVAMGKFPQ